MPYCVKGSVRVRRNATQATGSSIQHRIRAAGRHIVFNLLPTKLGRQDDSTPGLACWCRAKAAERGGALSRTHAGSWLSTATPRKAGVELATMVEQREMGMGFAARETNERLLRKAAR